MRVTAQRRPERQPRLHPHPDMSRRCRPALNEGRSVNPGYTGPHADAQGGARRRSTKAGASTPATRAARVRELDRPARSTKAGASTPATHWWSRLATGPRTALNEGRSVNPGYTLIEWGESLHFLNAQRRPERQPRLHPDRVGREPALSERSTKAGASTPATPLTSSTRISAPCFAQRRPERQPRLHQVPKAIVTAKTDDAQRRPERQPRLHIQGRGYIRVGRDAQRRPERQPRLHKPGVTSASHGSPRSTKAGASTPATRASCWCPQRACSGPLNEGRSVNPGYTAKFCKRAVSGQTIARPRVREPRQRRVCVHFTRFRTIPRQNGQDQAVETALTAARHTRFPRITEGSQISQSTQGWPSS